MRARIQPRATVQSAQFQSATGQKFRSASVFLPAAALWFVIAATAHPVHAQDAPPNFIKPGECIAVTAIHVENQRGESHDARRVTWHSAKPASKREKAKRNELRLCFFKRGRQIAVRAYSWIGGGWRGPHVSGLSEVLTRRDMLGNKIDSGCLAIRRELPGSFGRIKHVMSSEKICDLDDRFIVHHQKIIDEGNQIEGQPARVLRKILEARLSLSENPITQ